MCCCASFIFQAATSYSFNVNVSDFPPTRSCVNDFSENIVSASLYGVTLKTYGLSSTGL